VAGTLSGVVEHEETFGRSMNGTTDEKQVESDRFEQVSGQLQVFSAVTSRVADVSSTAAGMAGTPH